MMPVTIDDNHIDDHVDIEIQNCLKSVPPQSFFLFAGAGSGKTRSLINTLEFLKSEQGENLAEHGKQIAVITYTNAASEEIQRRLQYDPIFSVSTIHSFLWELIKNYQSDIKEWIENKICSDIAELMEKQRKARTALSIQKKQAEIAAKEKRLKKIKTVRRFTYNPNGTNVGNDSLSHDEVIKIGSAFIATEATMQRILVAKFPILLIDESQDTKKELVDALLCVYDNHKQHWAMGMFGDTMQKIYSDGKENLANCVPIEWQFPCKIMNHRSAQRIVSLANEIRKTIDGNEQRFRSDAKDGHIALFIVEAGNRKETVEQKVAKKMSGISGDVGWTESNGYKSLILEHHMAAARFGFSNLYTPLNDAKVFDTALKDGSIPEISFLSEIIIPLVASHKDKDDFGITKILRKYSPLLKSKQFAEHPALQKAMLQSVEHAVDNLLALWENDNVPTCIEILKNIYTSGVFALPERVPEILNEAYAGDDEKIIALKKALQVSFLEVERYSAYVTGKTKFATHQGVKGLEFPRVMVILDDAGAKGFLFSYEKLFGAKEKTEVDCKNEQQGKDTSISRTARLFYVACTRAQESLAVVAYTEDPDKVSETVIANKWFKKEEIFTVTDQDGKISIEPFPTISELY